MESSSFSSAANQGLRRIVCQKPREAIADGSIRLGSKLSEIEREEPAR